MRDGQELYTERKRKESREKKKTRATLNRKDKTTYYVRVRYVGTDGVSAWSKVKRVRTK